MKRPRTGSARWTAVVVGALLVCFASAGTSQALVMGSLRAWGNNANGQCDVPSGNDFVAVAGGWDHSLALRVDGSLVAWGNNDVGQCNVPAGNDFVAIATSFRHNLALRKNGSAVGWGWDYQGICDIPAGVDFAALDGGKTHSLGLTAGGQMITWGWDMYNILAVPPGNDFVAVDAGDTFNLGLRANGSLAAAGRCTLGECAVPGGNDYVAIAAGGAHGVALKQDGAIVTWGHRHGSGGAYPTPAGDDFAAIAADEGHNLALKNNGSLLAWGNSAFGMTDNTPGGYDFLGVGCGRMHNLAIQAIIRNRNFQAGVLDGWAVTGAGSAEAVEYPGGSGNYVAELTAGSEVVLSQLVDTPEIAFLVTFDYAFQSAGTLDVLLNEQLIDSLEATAAGHFTPHSIPVADLALRGLPGVELAFRFDGATGSQVLLDNVDILPVPEPSTLAGLLAVALVGLWRLRRRRR